MGFGLVRQVFEGGEVAGRERLQFVARLHGEMRSATGRCKQCVCRCWWLCKTVFPSGASPGKILRVPTAGSESLLHVLFRLAKVVAPPLAGSPGRHWSGRRGRGCPG